MDRNSLLEAFGNLIDLVSRLRGPGGCPWDALQTADTVRMYLLEEACEVLDAVERGRPEDVCGELGDLLFQIVFLARIAEEGEEFDFGQVLEEITEKMINRHPHVFGSTRVESAGEVAENWARIKEEEGGGKRTASSLLQGVPATLPALLRAHRLCERASKVEGAAPEFRDWEGVEALFRELAGSVSGGGDNDRIGPLLGDLLFALSGYAGSRGLNAEDLLRRANLKFLEDMKDKEP